MREPHKRELFLGSECGKKFSGLDDLKKHERTPQQRKGIQLHNANVTRASQKDKGSDDSKKHETTHFKIL